MNDLIKRILDYLKYGKKRDGLIEKTDERNFGSKALYVPVKEDLVDKTFIVFDPKSLDQLDSDFCVGYGGAYEADATEDFDGESKQGSGAYVFAGAKKYSRRAISNFGISLLDGCMARITYGICKKELWDYQKGRRNFFATWSNIPQEAHEDAKKHKAGTVWQLQIPWGMSHFDAIRATLWHFRDKRVLIGTGNQAHRITVIGYDKGRDSLVCRDTYGERTYNNGIRYINRNEAKTLFTSYFVIDIERDLAELLIMYKDKAIKLEDSKDCYLVRGGEKHLLRNEPIAWSNNTLLFDPNYVSVVSKEDFDKIPTGKDAEFKDGKNYAIVQRILEKVGKLDLLKD